METPRNWRKLEVHELAEIFPPMSEVELVALRTGMEANGYDRKQPVLLFEGKILDGRHRRDVAAEVGKEPSFDEYKGNDPIQVVIARNLHRRHLTESQRGLVGGRLATLTHGGDRKSDQAANLPLDPTQAEVASLLSVSERTVRDGHAVATEGTPALQEAVASGEVKVSDAAAIVDEPAKVQNEAVKKVRQGKASTLRAATGKKRKGGPNANGKHAGQSQAEKAQARIARQRSAADKAGIKLVSCRYCIGTGQVPEDPAEFPPELDVQEFHEAWSIWLAERRAKRIKAYTPEGLKRTLAELAGWGLRQAIIAIDTSIKKSWQGLFEPGKNGKPADPYAGLKAFVEKHR